MYHVTKKKLFTLGVAAMVSTSIFAMPAAAADDTASTITIKSDLDGYIQSTAQAMYNSIMSDGVVKADEFRYAIPVLESGLSSETLAPMYASIKKTAADNLQAVKCTSDKSNWIHHLYGMEALTLAGEDVSAFTASDNQVYDLGQMYSDYITADDYKNIGTSLYAWAPSLEELAILGDKVPNNHAIATKMAENICNDEGAWGFSNSTDVDTVSMGLTGLAPYTDLDFVSTAVSDGSSKLIGLIDKENGTFSSWGNANVDSTGYAVTAASRLGFIDQLVSEDGKTAIDGLFSFYDFENGAFKTAYSPLIANYDGIVALMAYRDTLPETIQPEETTEETTTAEATTEETTTEEATTEAETTKATVIEETTTENATTSGQIETEESAAATTSTTTAAATSSTSTSPKTGIPFPIAAVSGGIAAGFAALMARKKK